MTIMLKGCDCDVLTDSCSNIRWTSGWRYNLIVHNCYVTLRSADKWAARFEGLHVPGSWQKQGLPGFQQT